MRREVSRHEGNRHEKDRDLGKENGNACEPLYRLGFFERYQIEVLTVQASA